MLIKRTQFSEKKTKWKLISMKTSWQESELYKFLVVCCMVSWLPSPTEE